MKKSQLPAAGGYETKTSELLQSVVIENSNKAERETEPHLWAAGSATAAQEAADAGASSFSHTWYAWAHVYVHMYESMSERLPTFSAGRHTWMIRMPFFYNY